jgi:thiosulfate/3-mercaptopyruvate sulfurtransferase
MTTHSNLISVEQLGQLIEQDSQESLIILDATMKKKPNGDAIPTPAKKIPRALAFNFDTEVCDLTSELPHMLPTSEQFEIAAQALGINQDSKIIVYDAMGIFSSPRAWWMFRVMGHKNVFVLDGGLPQWLKTGRDISSHYAKSKAVGNFKSEFDSSRVIDSQQVLDNIDSNLRLVLDARSRERFSGEAPEPRTTLRPGHIPSSICLPFTDLLQDAVFKSPAAIKSIFAKLTEAYKNELIFSCGSGVTACILALAAEEAGLHDYQIYDGSWSEWGSSDKLPIDLG